MTDEQSAEGSYVDPFGEHEARWFSDGEPTALVRDAGIAGNAPPPDRAFDGPLIEYNGTQSEGGDDHLRADSADATYNPKNGVRAALDEFDRRPRR